MEKSASKLQEDTSVDKDVHSSIATTSASIYLNDQSSVISIASLWKQSTSASINPKVRLELADSKYDKFYLVASKKQAAIKTERLERDLNRAAMLCMKDAETAFKSKKVNIEDIFAKPPPRSRLER